MENRGIGLKPLVEKALERASSSPIQRQPRRKRRGYCASRQTAEAASCPRHAQRPFSPTRRYEVARYDQKPFSERKKPPVFCDHSVVHSISFVRSEHPLLGCKAADQGRSTLTLFVRSDLAYHTL